MVILVELVPLLDGKEQIVSVAGPAVPLRADDVVLTPDASLTAVTPLHLERSIL